MTKKDGTIYYKSSVTYQDKHISLGSFSSEDNAHTAYLFANSVLHGEQTIEDYPEKAPISFEKYVILVNFRDNHLYFANPIYIRKNHFLYYLSQDEIFTFDRDDLFFYSSHKIQKRGGRLFVAHYGMQLTLKNRYGIKNFAVCGRDYIHRNGDERDFRYDNIEIISRYYGVRVSSSRKNRDELFYKSYIHVNGDWVIGQFPDEITAAIAYNKAADYLHSIGIEKHFQLNEVTSIPASNYAEIYTSIDLTKFAKKFTRQ